MDPCYSPGSADMYTGSIPLQPNRILSDIPPLQRVIIAVAVVIQAGLLIILLTRQADELLQLLRVLFIQQVAPFIVFCAPFCSPFRTDKRQRQAAMVAVVQVDFSRRRVHRVHLVLHLLHRQAARCQPAATFLTHPVSQISLSSRSSICTSTGGNTTLPPSSPPDC